ncbi:hypothetical protein M153_1576000256 [Pseudoloma neurophilia]|uniref:Uncharacterized protein n=1 Tax=Pseudoloma neurophilia TaxID=146866 RepID=A0A0R0M2P3_9MICR|nr:hypothetical protein M153_1576000256 [Pseudoloma neurophilia]
MRNVCFKLICFICRIKIKYFSQSENEFVSHSKNYDIYIFKYSGR